MFYSHNLLSHKRGKFAIVWLAATRGERFLTKKDIHPIDLCATCNEIIGYINCNKKDRLSLYLSAQLTLGICRVYRKKATIILVELQDLYTKSLRSFQPDLMNITLPKKGQPRGAGKCKKQGESSFTSLIDLHPTNVVPEAREDFGQLILPVGIDAKEGMRGNAQPYVDDWIISQIPGGDSIVDISQEFRDSNQARPEDITMREDQMPVENLLGMSITGDTSIVMAAGGQGAEELQLPPMNLEYFEEAREQPRESREDAGSRHRPATDFGDERLPKQRRVKSPDRPRRSQRISSRVEVTAVVHSEPPESAQIREEGPEQQAAIQEQAQEQPQEVVQEQLLYEQVQGPLLQEPVQEQPSTGRHLYDIIEDPRLEHEMTVGDTSIRLFEDAQPSGVPAVENILEESISSTQTKVVKETPEDQQPSTSRVQEPPEPPPAANATIGDTTATDASLIEQLSDMQIPSSVERLLIQPGPPAEPTRRRRPIRRRRDRLIVDELMALTREDIRAQLVANGRGLMREISFPPAHVLPSAERLLSHPGDRNLGSALQRLWRERQVLCSQAPFPVHTKRRRVQRPDADGDSIRPQDLSSLEIERRRGGSGKNSMLQSIIGASDVSIIPATASNSLLGDSALTSTSHQQSSLHAGSKAIEVVDETIVQQQQQEQQIQMEQIPVEQQIDQPPVTEQEQRQELVEHEKEQQQPQQLLEEQHLLMQATEQLPQEELQQTRPEEQEMSRVQVEQRPTELDINRQQLEQQNQEKEQQIMRYEKQFEEQSDVWRRLKSFEKEMVLWSELCNRKTTIKKDAATAFVAILEFSKKGLVFLRQQEPFGEIAIKLLTSC